MGKWLARDVPWSRGWLAGVIAATLAFTALDIFTGQPALGDLLVVGPLVACVVLPPRQTLIAGVVAVAAALLVAGHDSDFRGARDLIAIGVVFACVLLASWVASARAQVMRAERLSRQRLVELQRTEQAERFLADASRVLASSLDYRTTLERVAQLAVPQLADWCSVELPDNDHIEHVALASLSREREQIARRVFERMPLQRDTQAASALAIATGRTQIERDLTETLDAVRLGREDYELIRQLEIRSLMAVPIVVGRDVLGAITLASSEIGIFDDEQRAIAEELGRRAGTAIENARLYSERAWIAETLQASLLPSALPEVPGVRVAARFRPAGEGIDVGGDFYDVFPAGDAWMAVIGDVTGKGPTAAATTALVRHAVRAIALFEPDPRAVLVRVNELLCEDRSTDQLCSVICLRIEPRDGAADVCVASGGHPLPLLLDRHGRVREVGEAGTILGFALDGDWPERRIALAAGEALVLYTDGITDATRGRQRFGELRLRETVQLCHGATAEGLAERLDTAVRTWERGPQRDDVALVVLGPERAAIERSSLRP